MLKRSRAETIKEHAASSSELALQLAQDKKFRKRLLSAVEHSSEAGRRTRRRLGFAGAVVRLATDETLRRALRAALADLQQAYERVEAKRRRRHKLRNFTLLAALAALAGLPQLRRRLVATIEKAVGSGSTSRAASGDSRAGPRRLEDLTKEELYARAQEAEIPGRSEMSKEQLVEALRARS
jgi:hypothetical protein